MFQAELIDLHHIHHIRRRTNKARTKLVRNIGFDAHFLTKKY
jgi:hypothetical protein